MRQMRQQRTTVAALLGATLIAAVPGCGLGVTGTMSAGPVQRVSPNGSADPAHPGLDAVARGVPRLKHVVVVLFENERAGDIIGNPDAPYINELADTGVNFTQSYAVTHPSQPNYIALFSGSTQGVKDDACQQTLFSRNNQANQMLSAGLTFMSYAEGLPEAGSKVCATGRYARKHAPWTNFSNVPPEVQQPFTSFPSDYTTLPDVSWVIPDMCNDMHDCSVATGDAWLEEQIGGYAEWAVAHRSLLIVTFDEDDDGGDNRIATIFYGARVVTGDYDERITHYSVLATMERMHGLPRLGGARKADAITDIWR